MFFPMFEKEHKKILISENTNGAFLTPVKINVKRNSVGMLSEGSYKMSQSYWDVIDR